jgi:hypothetical protein
MKRAVFASPCPVQPRAALALAVAQGEALTGTKLKCSVFGEDYSRVFVFKGVHECYAV